MQDRQEYTLLVQDRQKHILLGEAALNGDIEAVKELLALRVIINPKLFYWSVSCNRLAIVRLLLEYDATLANEEYLEPSYKLPLVCAADNGSIMIVRELLKYGARVNEKERKCGQPTALIIAAQHNWENTDEGEDSLAVVNELLDHGANPNAQTQRGKTALMFAAENNAVAIVNTLLLHGARADIKDEMGETAVTKARKNGHIEVANKLERLLPTPPAECKESKSTEITKTDRKNKAFFEPSESVSIRKKVEKEQQENSLYWSCWRK